MVTGLAFRGLTCVQLALAKYASNSRDPPQRLLSETQPKRRRNKKFVFLSNYCKHAALCCCKTPHGGCLYGRENRAPNECASSTKIGPRIAVPPTTLSCPKSCG